MKRLVVFTDGACSMNKTWTGGWAYLIVKKNDGGYITKSGFEYKTTNNRMELYAVLRVLQDVKRLEQKHKTKYRLEVISDSGYVVFPFIKYGWVSKWCNREFAESVKNYDLWRRVMQLAIYFDSRLKFTHIRGHGKNSNQFYNMYNNLVDVECVKMRLKADNL